MTTQGKEPLLRLGLIGLGRAAVSLLPSILNHPYVQITAAADRNQEARHNFERDFNVTSYAEAEALCDDRNVDAVYISTPHEFHAPQAILAAHKGKHVLVEKPMALTIEECESMRSAADGKGVHLIVGHTHSYDRPILKMREIIRNGEFGRLAMINTWNFSPFLYRPRRPEELDTTQGGGIIFNQVPHQVDMVRLLGGGLVRSVRSRTWVLDPDRPTEGSHATFLDFADGTAATLVYSGYDFFDSDEFHFWVGEEGQPKEPNMHGNARRTLRKAGEGNGEGEMKASGGYRGSLPSVSNFRHPHFGVLIASCAKGDLRAGPGGVLVYDEMGMRELPVSTGVAFPDKGTVLDELYGAVAKGQPPLHDGAWGQATLEVCLAVLTSSNERREIQLIHQVPLESEEGM